MPSTPAHTPEMHLVCQHGWGFSERCWQGWHERVPPPVLLGNRGYWGTPCPVEGLELPPGFVLVCHSLGFHLLSPGVMAKAGLLVIISGFAHFHGVHAEDGRFSRRHIGKMRSRLPKEPEGLIRDFHRDCAYPNSPPDLRAMDTELLARDLTLLDQSRLTAERCQGIPPALILHGRDDRIVLPERARELAEMLPASSRVVIIDHAGHGLPFTHPDLCLDLIRAAYQALSSLPHDRL